jgi:hypothetical protein
MNQYLNSSDLTIRVLPTEGLGLLPLFLRLLPAGS